jgi:hypothetical protein
MVSADSGAGSRPALPVPAVVAACVVLVAVAVVVAWRSLAPPPPTPITANAPGANPQVTQDTEWMKKVAKDAGGDINKVSPADLQRIQSITRGNAAQAVKFYGGQ